MRNVRMILAAALLLVSSALFAQNETYSVKIKFVDSQTSEGVGYATVSLTKDGSETVYKYGQTDGDGVATFKGVAKGKYQIKGTLLGYKDYSDTFSVSKDTDLGTKKMAVNAEYLEGATVSDVGNPIIVKKDTIEHNVSMMKISDTDVLEDLLKRLPGVEVSSDGTITANGKTIEKIQIDGREFFANDPQMATKNLPANIIEKVRVVEKKSDQARFTGIDDGEETTVLDLGIKSGMMNGLLGNILAGGGADVHSSEEFDIDSDLKNKFRYQGNALLAKITSSSQTAFIGNANNGGRQGFGGRQMGAGGGIGGMRGAGAGGGGETSSYMGGINGGYTFDEESELIMDGSVDGSNRYVHNETDRTTFYSDGSSLNSLEDGTSYSNSYSLRASSRADFQVNDKTSFIIEPNISYGWGNTDESEITSSTGTTADGLNRKVNDGNSTTTGDNKSISAGTRFMYRQRLGKAGRTLTVDGRYTYSKNTTDGYNRSTTNIWSDLDENGNQTIDSVAVVDQLFNQWSNSNSLNARATYTEPLGNNFYGELNYSLNWSKSNSGKDTYNMDTAGNYNVRDELYSSDIVNTRTTNSFGFNVRKQEDKFNFTVGANIQPNKQVNETHNKTVDTTLTLNVVNWSPQARIDVNFSDYKVLRINYRGRSSQPSINQLMPVPDNSNPLRVSLGNMDLNPSFTHNMDISYRMTSLKNFSSINLSTNGSYKPSSIVNVRYTDASGVTYTIPRWIDKGTWTGGGNIMFNSPIGTSKFSVMAMSNFNYSNGYSYVAGSSADIDVSDLSGKGASYLNFANYTENMYQNVSASGNFRLTYRNTYLEVAAGASTRYSQAFYSVSSGNNVNPTWTNGIDANIILKHDIINFSTDARYSFYKGYTAGYGDPTLVWNAEISKNIFKKTTTLSVKMYDILNQSRSISRTTTDNYVYDSRTNTLGRYFIVSLSYRFGNFGGRGNRRGGDGQRGGMGGGFGGPGGMGGGFGGPGGMR